jgi:hypothetical protein
MCYTSLDTILSDYWDIFVTLWHASITTLKMTIVNNSTSN